MVENRKEALAAFHTREPKIGVLNMKKLSNTLFNQINIFMNIEARSLERSIFNYYFNDLSENDILDSLVAFQNSDGGFGRGIEPELLTNILMHPGGNLEVI